MFSNDDLETMQDYLSQVDPLDRFGLFEGILDDEGLEGSLMGFKMSGPKGSIKSLEIDTPDLLDTLLSPADIDPLSQEWMETLDLSDLLAYDVCGAVITNPSLPPQSVQPVQEVQPEANEHQSTLLKILLTISLPATPSPSSASSELSISPVASPVPEAVALVEQPKLSTLSIDDISSTCTRNDNDAFVLDSSGVESGSEGVSILISPLSPEDIDSLLSSSPPTSPSDFLKTGDSSCNDEYMEMDTDSVVSPGSSFECKVSKSKKSRQEPYCIEYGKVGRKEKKKVQNKNAATRYRLKKRAEKQALQSDESKLEEKNKDLKEQVESLQREISYMKDLMVEIYKAKGFKK